MDSVANSVAEHGHQESTGPAQRGPDGDKGDFGGEVRQQPQDTSGDTEDPEDIGDLERLLLPSGAFPRDVEQFSVSYSRALLDGWVRQTSPCCAASSVAGAWNALQGVKRRQAGALDSEAVLKAMRAVLEKQISDMTSRFERLLGARIDPLISAIRAELSLEGKYLGSRGPKSTIATGPHLLRLTRRITERERAASAGSSGSSSIASGGGSSELLDRASSPNVFERLWELYEPERAEAVAGGDVELRKGQASIVPTFPVVAVAKNKATDAGTTVCLPLPPDPEATSLSQTKTSVFTRRHGVPPPRGLPQVVDKGNGDEPRPSGASCIDMTQECVVNEDCSSRCVSTAVRRSAVSCDPDGGPGSPEGGNLVVPVSNIPVKHTKSIAAAAAPTEPPSWPLRAEKAETLWIECQGTQGRREQATRAEPDAEVPGGFPVEDHETAPEGQGYAHGSCGSSSATSGPRPCPLGDLERSSFWGRGDSDDTEGTEDEGVQGDEIDEEDEHGGGVHHDTGDYGDVLRSINMEADERDGSDDDREKAPSTAGSRASFSVDRGSPTFGHNRLPLERERDIVTMSGAGKTGKSGGRGSSTRCGMKGLRKTKTRRGGGTSVGRWRWKKDLCDLLKRIGGLEKLCARRPSTGALGNLGVITTVYQLDNELASSASAQVTADLFMGKTCSGRGPRVNVPLSARDTEEDKAKQWNSLREAFLQQGQVLIFHSTNHYALIFALREWRPSISPPPSPPKPQDIYKISTGERVHSSPDIDPHRDAGKTSDKVNARGDRGRELPCTQQTDHEGFSPDAARNSTDLVDFTPRDPGEMRWTRELLTARRGQRPSAWISFEEAREIMLGWTGYKVIAVRRGQSRLNDVSVLR